MADDYKHLRPAEVARLLNRQCRPGDRPVSARDVRRHRDEAGLAIGDGETVHLLKYAAWLRQVLSLPGRQPQDEYQAVKERARLRSRSLALAGRDIGELPAPRHPRRQKRAMGDFRYFAATYFPHTFTLKWSPDHLTIIRTIETAVTGGGLFTMAMPRGSGKTSLCEIAAIWTCLTRGAYVCLIGSDKSHAEGMLESIKTELETNEDLAADWPAALYPIQALEGIAQRAHGQLYRQERTRIDWTDRRIVFPTIAGSPASGAVIQVAGLLGRIRGMKYKRADGTAIRPSLVIPDDPQTDQSARSPNQCAAREAVLAGAVLLLAGPGKKISGIMPCTVIRPGDLADRMLDRTKHPEWQGIRMKMVYAFPSNTELWDRYRQIRGDELRAGGDGTQATRFYRQHRRAMDAGAKVAWPQRKHPDELSAIQHAMNLKFRDERAFQAEMQNEPLAPELGEAKVLKADEIADRINGRARGQVPLRATVLTAFCDVHDELHYWQVTAWEPELKAGYVIDYGTFPQQPPGYFTLETAQIRMSHVFPQAGKEGAVHAGLKTLLNDLVTRTYRRDDGAEIAVTQTLVDTGYDAEIVGQVIRLLARGPALMPARGYGIRAGNKPFSDYKPEPGVTVGQHWRKVPAPGTQLVTVNVDTNWWKSWWADRLTTAVGDRGHATLFGTDPEIHRLYADHQTSEFAIRTFGRGRWLDEWHQLPDRFDNHWWDCAVGCAVAASLAGLKMPEWEATGVRRTGSWFAQQKKRGGQPR